MAEQQAIFEQIQKCKPNGVVAQSLLNTPLLVAMSYFFFIECTKKIVVYRLNTNGLRILLEYFDVLSQRSLLKLSNAFQLICIY